MRKVASSRWGSRLKAVMRGTTGFSAIWIAMIAVMVGYLVFLRRSTERAIRWGELAELAAKLQIVLPTIVMGSGVALGSFIEGGSNAGWKRRVGTIALAMMLVWLSLAIVLCVWLGAGYRFLTGVREVLVLLVPLSPIVITGAAALEAWIGKGESRSGLVPKLVLGMMGLGGGVVILAAVIVTRSRSYLGAS